MIGIKLLSEIESFPVQIVSSCCSYDRCCSFGDDIILTTDDAGQYFNIEKAEASLNVLIYMY